MHPQMQLTAAVFAIALLIFTVEMIRRNKLLEDYSLLWFVLGAAILILAVWQGSLDFLARVTGAAYKPSAVYISALALCLALLMHFSIIISRLTARVNVLVQQVALLSMQAGDEGGLEAIGAETRVDE